VIGMPEHLRAFVIILVLSSIGFLIGRRPALWLGMADADFKRRCATWLTVTTLAFVSHNFWLFALSAAAVLAFASHREPNRLALYFFVLFAVPPFTDVIPGLGVVRQLFALSYPRLLSLVVLLPCYLYLRRQPGNMRFGKHPADWFLFAYLALQVVLRIGFDTGTNTLRFAFYQFIDVFLPYYVASRSLRSVDDLRDAVLAFVIAAALMAPIAAYEFAKHWLLYNPLPYALGTQWDAGSYLLRGSSLRAVVTTGQSIVLGYVMAVALNLHLGLRGVGPRSWAWLLGVAALVAGMVAPLARGPWVGAAAGVFVMVVSSPNPLGRVMQFGAACLVILPPLLVSPLGDNIIDHLPFVGTIDASTVVYRQRLVEISMSVIAQNPLFGAADFIYNPAMQELKQGGQGIIDIVNSYLAVALGSGVVGLTLFVGVFASVAWKLISALRSPHNERGTEDHLLGRALLAALTVVVVTIATVSSISFIPIVYWCLCGMAAGYAMRVLAREEANAFDAQPSAPAVPIGVKWQRR
jgi:hypothetical protein